MVVAGVDLASSRALVALADWDPDIYVCIGFHPHEAAGMRPRDTEELRALAKHPKVVAIGEIGLDYHFDHSPRDVQREVFSRQLLLAQQLGLPVVVHSRESGEDVYRILAEWAKALGGQESSTAAENTLSAGMGGLGMLHCFSEGVEEACQYLDLGFSVSLSGTVSYPNAHKTRQVAAHIPLDRLLTETDAPYLPPQALRGHRNEPANVAAVVSEIAALRGLEGAEVASRTADNTIRLFRLSPGPSAP